MFLWIPGGFLDTLSFLLLSLVGGCKSPCGHQVSPWAQLPTLGGLSCGPQSPCTQVPHHQPQTEQALGDTFMCPLPRS